MLPIVDFARCVAFAAGGGEAAVADETTRRPQPREQDMPVRLETVAAGMHELRGVSKRRSVVTRLTIVNRMADKALLFARDCHATVHLRPVDHFVALWLVANSQKLPHISVFSFAMTFVASASLPPCVCAFPSA